MYTKQTWTNGDLIIASKLNHIEEGIDTNQLPAITTDDIGKYLIGVEDFEHPESSEVLFPQQTVTTTTSDGAELTQRNENITGSYDYAVLTVGNNKYLYVDNNGSTLNIDGSEQVQAPYYYLYFNDRTMKWYFSVQDANYDYVAGTYTVSVDWVLPSVKWGLGYPSGGGGIDMPVT